MTFSNLEDASRSACSALGAAIVCAALLAPGGAWAQGGVPEVDATAENGVPFPGSGYLWGQILFPSSRQKEELRDALFQGGAFHGFDVPFVGRFLLNPFVQFDYQADNLGLDYYNSVRPALGVQIKYPLANYGSIAAGIREEWNYNFVPGQWLDQPVYFLNWYRAWQWDLAASGQRDGWWPGRLLGLARGEIRYPGAPELNEKDNAIASGAFALGVDLWARKPFTLNTFVQVDYRADVKQLDFNNRLQPAIGAKLALALTDSVAIEAGGEIASEYRFVSGTVRTGPLVFVNWSAAW